ncbi:AfsR/SARP family transcriptional regulator [Actinophytocola glycyrrhizae]|uniref:Tetratricopeptide repeat protein n=1 Tax=Actinophytocola glycyrrhizae TaxID=2044873 RepID=A0ABV9S6B5_9PSEU
MDALLGILGTTALVIDGEVDDTWGKPRERAVLATLAVHVGRVVQLETLIRWAWPADKPIPQNPATTFHTYAARIRNALRALPTPTEVRARHGGYRLEIDPALIDRNRFRTLVTQGRARAAAHEPEQAIELIDRALALSRGSPIADLTSPAAAAWRNAVIETELLTAHTTLVEQLLALRRFDAALTRLDDLHGDYPDDVTLASLRLTALYGGLRRTHATSFYFAVRSRLRANGDDQAAEYLRQHHDTLRTEHGVMFRPVPTLTPQQLPPDRPGFVGRTEPLGMLDAIVDVSSGEPAAGVVVIDGIGGVGKTVLAVHWAHDHRHLFPGGALFVNMHGYADRAKVEHITVVDDFLTALGHPPEATFNLRRREQLLSSLLADKKTLVLLDNVRDTAHVRDLVPLLSNCVVLITSRQWLTSLQGEFGARRITLRPMSASEGARLLSAQLGPGNEIGDEQLEHFTTLCGGLPLLLTVIAGDLAGKSATGVEEYSALVDRRDLVRGLGDKGDGPVSGAACFAPSYRALAAPERRLFRLLTLHPGPEIGLDAACVCDGRQVDDTTTSLGKLAGAHLVEEADSVRRYRFHDVLAEFAAQCRDADEPQEEQAAAERRVLNYYLGSVTNACRAAHRSYNPPPRTSAHEGVRLTTFDDSDSARQWFARERANLTAAITYAAEHGYHDHVWRLTDPVTTFFDRAGNVIGSRAVRQVALRSARALGNREAEASMLSFLAMAHMMLGDHDEARRCLEAALPLATENGLDRGEASILHLLGRVALRREDPAEALDLFRRGMEIDQKSGNREGLCWAHCRIGHALHALDQHEQALAHLNRAALLAQEIGESSAEAASLSEIGAIHRELGDLAMAAGCCEQALAIAQSVPDMSAMAGSLVDLCEINRVRRRSRVAVDYGRQAIDLCEKTHDILNHARALEALGTAQYECGDLVDAAVAWRHAADMYDEAGNSTRSARLRSKIETVPTFYREVVPIARSAQEATAGNLPWLADEETTQPLVPGTRSTDGQHGG